MESGALGPIESEYISSSLTSAASLLGVINQVLEFAKLESGEHGHSAVELTMEPFSILTLASDLVRPLSYMAEQQQRQPPLLLSGRGARPTPPGDQRQQQQQQQQ